MINTEITISIFYNYIKQNIYEGYSKALYSMSYICTFYGHDVYPFKNFYCDQIASCSLLYPVQVQLMITLFAAYNVYPDCFYVCFNSIVIEKASFKRYADRNRQRDFKAISPAEDIHF